MYYWECFRHLQEHMEIPRDVKEMSSEELLFHYFRMYDSDQNAKLDGLELVKALIHNSRKFSKQ